jgi:glycosyltransferase involved in cell wall biosynthesis
MDTPLISVIIPLYNAEKYIEQTLGSIQKQTYTNFEVLLIDDGSIDKTAEICKRYSASDPRIKYVHKDNGGVGSARNLGIEKASGEWISFIDGDDEIVPQYFEELLRCAQQEHSKMSCCNIQFYNLDGSITSSPLPDVKRLNVAEIQSEYFVTGPVSIQFYGPYNKLIHNTLLSKIKFEKYALGEDLLFMFKLLTQIDYVAISNLNGYRYIKRENSATTSKFSAKKLDYIRAAHALIDISKNINDEVYEKSIKWSVRHIINTLRQIYKDNKADDFREFIVSEKKFLKSNNKYVATLPWKFRIRLFLIKCFPTAFRLRYV